MNVQLGTRSNGEVVYLRLANTHLQAGSGDGDVRRDQIGELDGYINRAYPAPMGQPLLFGGDFNVAQTGWAGDLQTWNQLYATMQSWYLDSVQKMCRDEGETACQGSGQAASDFQSEVQQLFITQPDTFDSDLGGYKLIPTRYQSVPDPNGLTDHPYIVADFAYQEMSPRKQMHCINSPAQYPAGGCPDNYPVLRGNDSQASCQLVQGCIPGFPGWCEYFHDWRNYAWACCCFQNLVTFQPGQTTCCRMGWFDTTISTDFNGGQIMVNGQTHPSGYIFNEEGVTAATLAAVSPQTVGGRVYYFDHWEKRITAGNVLATTPRLPGRSPSMGITPTLRSASWMLPSPGRT